MKKMGFFVIVFLALLISILAPGQVFGNIHRVVFPQFAFGGGWTTTILVTNVSDKPAQVTVGFGVRGTGGIGTGTLVPIVRRNGSVAMVGGYNPGDIPPKGSWTNTLKSTEPTITVGSMVAMVNIVDGKDTMQVQVTYSYSPNGSVESQAAVFPSTPATVSTLQVFRPDTDSDMGIAIANPNFAPANVNLKIHNMAGEVVGSGYPAR